MQYTVCYRSVVSAYCMSTYIDINLLGLHRHVLKGPTIHVWGVHQSSTWSHMYIRMCVSVGELREDGDGNSEVSSSSFVQRR